MRSRGIAPERDTNLDPYEACSSAWAGYRFPVVDLSEEQKTIIARWVGEGADLNGVQKRLKDEWEMSITYLETRFLISDLGLTIQETKKTPDVAPAPDNSTLADAQAELSSGAQPLDSLLPDGVTVTTDSIARPGMLVSGRVTFSGGQAANWYLDQMGRLGLDPDDPDHRPSDADVMAFQDQLQKILQKQGY